MKDTQTIDVYDTQIDEYDNLTRKQSHDPALQKFISLLKPGGYVLDLGCGPAVASSIMRDNGLRVDAVDASKEMVRLANEKFDIGARQALFSDIEGTDVYDGLWANFSLLHATVSEFTSTLPKLNTAMVEGGVFHIGMKLGTGSARDKLGRFYTYYTEEDLRDHLQGTGFAVDDVEVGEGLGLAGNIEPWIYIVAYKR